MRRIIFLTILLVVMVLSLNVIPRLAAVAQGNGTIVRISEGMFPEITPDGRFIVYSSGSIADCLAHISVYDRLTGMNTCGADSVHESGSEPSISADGRYIAFHSGGRNIVPDDTNQADDVFVHDRQTGRTTRVSVASDGTQANNDSLWSSISANGRYVAFTSVASNLVPNDRNNRDVFVHDRQTGQTTRVSVASDGTPANRGIEAYNTPEISADGRYIAFGSHATNLVVNDTNDTHDVFVHDRQTGQTTRVSVASDGTQADDDVWDGLLSTDGRFVTLISFATNLVGYTYNGLNLFVHDRETGQTDLISYTYDGSPPAGHFAGAFISTDGRYVSFMSNARNIVPDDTNFYCGLLRTNCTDVFVHDRQTGQTTRVSVASDGTEANAESDGGFSMSDDGHTITFSSRASNLVPGDTNEDYDIFVYEWDGTEPPPEPTPTPNLDRDRDGLSNVWETQGIDLDGDGIVEVDLPALGADPNHKDIFVYADWLQTPGLGHSHHPEDALEKVKEAFANAPVENPDGNSGINLHIIFGQMVAETESNQILGHYEQSGESCDYNWSEFDEIKASSPSFTDDMQRVFHYALFAHNLPNNCSGQQSGGLARNNYSSSDEFREGSSDFIVALGLWEFFEIPPHLPYNISDMRAGTFMHELGHDLGLHHGGITLDQEGNVVGPDDTTWKPNHLSVMNYTFQNRGLRTKGALGLYWDGVMDYSRFDSDAIADLHESNLDETEHLSTTSLLSEYGTRYYCPSGKEEVVDGLQQPIDWNCDGDTTDRDLSLDLTRDRDTTDILSTANEWQALIYTGGNIGGSGALVELPTTTAGGDELTFEEDPVVQESLSSFQLYLPILSK